MRFRRVAALLRPNRYLLVVFAFLVLFPFFMDLITPDVVSGYAGGTVDAQGNEVTRYEGGTAPQYQWYYPLVYPFLLAWYLAVLGFEVVDAVLPVTGTGYYLVRTAYFYLLAAAIAPLLRGAVRGLAAARSRLPSGR